MKILLKTTSGRTVASVESAAVTLMTTNGAPPQMVCWEQRFFYRDPYDSDNHLKARVYKEGLCYVVTHMDQVSVDGTVS